MCTQTNRMSSVVAKNVAVAGESWPRLLRDAQCLAQAAMFVFALHVSYLLGTLDDLRQVEQDAAEPRVRRHDCPEDGAVSAGDVDDPIKCRCPPEVCNDRRGSCISDSERLSLLHGQLSISRSFCRPPDGGKT